MNDISLSEECKKRKNLSEQKRELIKSKGCCEICGHTFKPILQIHHIEPLSTGGNDEEENLLILCPNCHKIIHSIDSDYSIQMFGSDYFDNWLDEHVSAKRKRVYVNYALKILRSRYPNA